MSAESTTVTFGVDGARRGFLECLPIALGVASYGVVFGMLAVQAGLSVLEASLMSATVLAGAAQLIAVDVWAEAATVPIAAVVVTTLLVNLRYLLMGAALRPWFGALSARAAYGSIFFTADENWALTMGVYADAGGSEADEAEADADTEADGGDPDGGPDQVPGAYLLGSGLAIWLCWVAATILGAVAGDGLGDPSRYGLDVVFLAVFVAIAVDLWDGDGQALPWAGAFAVALATAWAVPGYWYVLTGALAGGLVSLPPLESTGDPA